MSKLFKRNSNSDKMTRHRINLTLPEAEYNDLTERAALE